MRKEKNRNYISRRRETHKRIISNKLRLTINNMLAEEINKYHHESNKHAIDLISSLEAEIPFLRKKIESMETILTAGEQNHFIMNLK